MAFFDVTQSALDKALQGAALRQQLIANNIANANTPGYKRSDVDFASQLQGALESGDPESAVAGTQFAAAPDTTSSSRADGNNVDIDSEMANLSENAVTYQTLVAVDKARLHMLEIAMTGGR